MDLVIVGGGPAGIATALHVLHHAPALAERMVVLEKEHYPRDKYCAGAIGARADRALEALGVRVESPSVRIEGVTLLLAGRPVRIAEPDMGRVIRRLEWDHAFAKEAMRRGVRVREGAAVEGVETVRGGVRVKLQGGDAIEAKVVVGADGVGSAVRRTCGFPKGELRAQVVELDTERVEGDPPHDTILFDFSDGALTGYAWDFPTIVDGQALMCRGLYSVRTNGHFADVRALLRAHLARKGLDMDRYRLKPFAERGWEEEAPISAPHVLLVGEAAGIDIATGEGIAQAVMYGALAAPYLADAFHSGDFRFVDWRRRLRAAEEGSLLWKRRFAFDWVFGPERPVVEHIAAAMPDMLRVGCQEFAGKPRDPAVMARGVAQLAAAALRYGPRLAWRLLQGRVASALRA